LGCWNNPAESEHEIILETHIPDLDNASVGNLYYSADLYAAQSNWAAFLFFKFDLMAAYWSGGAQLQKEVRMNKLSKKGVMKDVIKKISTRKVVEAGIMLALAQVLSYIKIFTAPQGGSVTAGSMIPIIFFAIRWGLKPGILVGVVYGILQFILGGAIYSFNILSVFLDYLLAYGALGFGGIFRKNLAGIFVGTSIAIMLRFLFHFLSGLIVFASYAPKGTDPVIYSLLYNATYLIPELVITIVIIGFLYNPIKRYIIQ